MQYSNYNLRLQSQQEFFFFFGLECVEFVGLHTALHIIKIQY